MCPVFSSSGDVRTGHINSQGIMNPERESDIWPHVFGSNYSAPCIKRGPSRLYIDILLNFVSCLQMASLILINWGKSDSTSFKAILLYLSLYSLVAPFGNSVWRYQTSSANDSFCSEVS